LDTVSGGREKDGHEWQQSETEAAYYIENLTSSDGLVVDFFGGSGTTAAAAKSLGRQFIIFEEDPSSVEKIVARVAAE
jgi:DNA modification methylase